MHFCIAVITDQFPTDDVLGQKLAPYDENAFYSQFEDREEIEEEIDKAQRPLFMWDYWQIGGRYGGQLKLKIDEKDPEYQWRCYIKEPRAGRLYRSKMIETHFNSKDAYGNRLFRNMEEDTYRYLGYDDGYIRVDGCRIRDAIDFENTVIDSFGFIGKDGTVYLREYWDGNDWIEIEDEEYEEKVRSAIQGIEDCYACFVDIHD